MTCHQLLPYIVDLARNRATRSPGVDAHLRGCDACAALLERERALSRRLHRLAVEVDGPARDDEAALMAAFDAAGQGQSRDVVVPTAAGVLAAGILIAVLAWRPAPEPSQGSTVRAIAREAVMEPGDPVSAVLPDQVRVPALPERSPRVPPRRSPEPIAADAGPFVTWPGAAAWPPFESGELIRVELAFDGGVVEADVLVGQDGFARAVRIIQ